MDEKMRYWCPRRDIQTNIENCSICWYNKNCDTYITMLNEYDDIRKDEDR